MFPELLYRGACCIPQLRTTYPTANFDKLKHSTLIVMVLKIIHHYTKIINILRLFGKQVKDVCVEIAGPDSTDQTDQ